MKFQRKSNFELLRIIAMLLIILSHCTYFGVVKVGQSDAYDVWKMGSTIDKLFTSSSILGAIGVGLFFMISGYFNANRQNRSLEKVILTTVFYSLLVFLFGIIVTLCGISLFDSSGNLLINIARQIFTPLSGSVWWFVTAYIVMMLFAPYYNRLLKRLTKRGFHFLILYLLIFGYTLGNLGSNFYDMEKAFFFYTLGAYFMFYPPKPCKKSAIALFVISFIMNGICQFIILNYGVAEDTKGIIARKMASLIDHLIAEPAACIALFTLFLPMHFVSEKINVIATHVFGVYLFHEAPIMRNLIWIKLLKPDQCYGSISHYFYIILCTLSVFIIGIAIDIIRYRCFEKNIGALWEKLIKKINHICMKDSQ